MTHVRERPPRRRGARDPSDSISRTKACLPVGPAAHACDRAGRASSVSDQPVAGIAASEPLEQRSSCHLAASTHGFWPILWQWLCGTRRAKRRCMMQPMPRVPPFDRPATYEDLVALPDTLVAEIVDGELHASPRPASPHARASSSLGVCLGGPYDHAVGGPGGWWILDEPELHFAQDVVVPDLAGWRRTRMPQFPVCAFFTLSPDWICEVLSPSTSMLDRAKKLAVYAREQVAHAWLIDPLARTLEVLRLDDGRWTILATHAGSDPVRADPFSEIELELASLWAD